MKTIEVNQHWHQRQKLLRLAESMQAHVRVAKDTSGTVPVATVRCWAEELERVADQMGRGE